MEKCHIFFVRDFFMKEFWNIDGGFLATEFLRVFDEKNRNPPVFPNSEILHQKF